MTNDLFFDTDCLSAFLWVNNTNLLRELYGGKIVLPEPVYQELSNPCIPHIRQRADALIEDQTASVKGLEKGLISEEEGNRIWDQMLAKRRWLPTKTFSEYLSEKRSQS